MGANDTSAVRVAKIRCSIAKIDIGILEICVDDLNGNRSLARTLDAATRRGGVCGEGSRRDRHNGGGEVCMGRDQSTMSLAVKRLEEALEKDIKRRKQLENVYTRLRQGKRRK
jgi:hypothetical protein